MSYTIPTPPKLPQCVGIHAKPCEHCPSTKGFIDPETQSYLDAPHSVRVESAFACGWRTNKHCKGYCDLMGVTERDITARIAELEG